MTMSNNHRRQYILSTNAQSPSGKWLLFVNDSGEATADGIIDAVEYPEDMRELLRYLGVDRVEMDVDDNGTMRQIPVEWIGDGDPLVGSRRALSAPS